MLNKVLIQGRLTKDPELKQTQSGVPMMIFTVAWSEKYKEIESRCFLLCKAWRQTAEFISKYFRKGQEIALEGHMVTEEWKEGENVTVCLVDKAHFCGSKGGDNNRKEERPHVDPDEFVNVPEGLEEELPFT